MVLFERAIIELSSFVASVTLRPNFSVVTLEGKAAYTYISEFGFFFFFKIAVDVSSSWNRTSASKVGMFISKFLTSFLSAPEASLVRMSVKVNSGKV